jgi:hypothetical protein
MRPKTLPVIITLVRRRSRQRSSVTGVWGQGILRACALPGTRASCLVGAGHLHELVIQAQDQQRRCPLAHEVALLLLAKHLQC